MVVFGDIRRDGSGFSLQKMEKKKGDGGFARISYHKNDTKQINMLWKDQTKNKYFSWIIKNCET